MTTNIEEHNRVVDYKDIVDLETMRAYLERYNPKETFTVCQLITMINDAISRGNLRNHKKEHATMNILRMTKQDFANVPYLDIINDWNKIAPNGQLEFNSFVIIPVENKDEALNLHESGFGCMEFCLVNKKSEPIGKVGGGSDVIALDGIGGYEGDWIPKLQGFPRLIPVHDWNIDLLPCGYLNVWTRQTLFIRSPYICSTLEVFSEDEDERRMRSIINKLCDS